MLGISYGSVEVENVTWGLRRIVQKYDILGFISECYDILHLNGYACVLHDVENLLKNRGVTV